MRMRFSPSAHYEFGESLTMRLLAVAPDVVRNSCHCLRACAWHDRSFGRRSACAKPCSPASPVRYRCVVEYDLQVLARPLQQRNDLRRVVSHGQLWVVGINAEGKSMQGWASWAIAPVMLF